MTEANGAAWTLDELVARLEGEHRRRGLPTPGGRAAEGASVRTIRYYTTLGLLDRPLGYQGGSARYGPRHLLQFLAIKVLQASFLPLPEIQKRLFGRTDEELTALLDRASEATAPVAPASEPPTAWLTCRVAPGLVLVADDRDAFHVWLARTPPEEVANALRQALDRLDPSTRRQEEPR